MATLQDLVAGALAAHKAGRTSEAIESYRQVLALQPAIPEVAFNLGVLCERTGDVPGAIDAYRQALAARSDWLAPLGNLGNLLRREGLLDQAQVLLERAAAIAPGQADTLGNLALLRIDEGRVGEARAAAEKATRLAPDEALWWEAAGTAARLQPDLPAAIEFLENATRLAPDDAGSWFELAMACDEDAREAEASAAFARARTLDPGWLRLRWAAALRLPAFIEDEAHAARALARWDGAIEALEQELRLETPREKLDALEAAESVQAFNLHYLPGDQGERQRRFAALTARVARAAIPLEASSHHRPAGDRRIRVGFVSSYLRTHVVARFFGRFITGLDPARFERHVWFTDVAGDAWTQEIAAAADHFHPGWPGLALLANAIHAADLDVLVYPDIGLDANQGLLAALRLAPVQAALYGHPVSTGLTSLDHYVVGEALEPAGGEAHYTEHLVRLPGLGAAPRAPGAAGDGAWANALREPGRPLAFCLQNLMKVPPAFDGVLARIAASTDAVLVFFDRGAGPSARFRTRLSRSLVREGVDPDRTLRIVPLQSYPEFLGGIARADLILDTPGFSGGGTSLDALAVGAAVLCFAGASARARQTAAMLRQLEVPELIAVDGDDYVAKALALLRDPGRTQSLRTLIAKRAPTLFDGREACRAFEAWLEGVVCGPLGSGPKDPI